MDRRSFAKTALAAAIAAQALATLAEEKTTAPKKPLIVYYSWGGNTKWVAEQIQKIAGADVFELEAVPPYTRNYGKVVEQALKERDADFKPKVSALPDVSKYDVIFVGTPSWWGTMASPVRSFVSKCDLSGKKLYVFITHKGSSWDNFPADLQHRAPKAVVEKLVSIWSNDGFKEKETQAQIATALRKLGF